MPSSTPIPVWASRWINSTSGYETADGHIVRSGVLYRSGSLGSLALAGQTRLSSLGIGAIVGNIVTSWSWFGVNMLGIGLHSYGFMDSAFKWLMAFVVSQLALIALGLLPDNLWASFRNRPVPPAKHGKGEPKPAAA